MRFSINLPNFGDFADPRRVAEVAVAAETAGWDGVTAEASNVTVGRAPGTDHNAAQGDSLLTWYESGDEFNTLNTYEVELVLGNVVEQVQAVAHDAAGSVRTVSRASRAPTSG